MDESNSSCRLALETKTIDDSLTDYISHVRAANLTYTIVRSVVFVSPGRLDEIFDTLHSFEHLKRCKKKTQQGSILLYWQEKPAICKDCTSFLSELLALSWRRSGPEISNRYNWSQLQINRFRYFDSELAIIMTDLFRYMSTAYERIEKETKDALQAKSHSSEFADACREYFGQNFDISKDAGRLEALLANLHETNINLLLTRLFGRHHIEDTIERDKQALSKGTTSTEEHTPALFEDANIQTEEQAAPALAKGKNYDHNKKKLERKKRKRATRPDNSQVDVSKDSKDSLKETVDKSAIFVERHDGSAVEVANATNISQDLTVVENVDIAQVAASTERVDETSSRDDIILSPKAVKQLIKIDCLLKSDHSEATDLSSTPPVISNPTEEQFVNVASEASQDKLASYQDEENLEAALEIEDDRNWTQVVGSRKKSKKSNTSGVNLYQTNAGLVKGSPRISEPANKPQSGEKMRIALEITPSPNRRPKKLSPVQKLHDPSTTASHSTNPKSSESTKPASQLTGPKPTTPKKKASALATPKSTVVEKTGIVSVTAEQKLDHLQTHAQVSVAIEQVAIRQELATDSKAPTIHGHQLPTPVSVVVKKQFSRSGATSAKSKVDILPSVLEAATASNSPLALNIHCNLTASATIADLKAFAPATATSSVADNHEDTKEPCRSSPFKLIDLAKTAASIADSHRDTKKRAPFLPSESIDPGPLPYYQHLKPFKKKAKKMSETTETTSATKTTPLTDTFSLVESLRDAGVEDDAMSSLVPRAATLTMSSTHLPLANVGSSQLRNFTGKHLDVRRANKSPKSAGNSPVPPQPEREPVYHYPPPDVLTPENQEILDLIIKGPPYKKYPRVQAAADQHITQPLAADFVTKKPPVTTYDGKDAYEVLGSRCPAPLTLKDHPNVNKCVQQGEIFHCAYCRVEISGKAEAEKGIICPGCGPCSETRYCDRSHLLADSISHFEVCGKAVGTYPLMWSELPLHYQSLFPYIKPLTGTLTAQCFRQMAHCLVINSDGIIQNPFKAYFDTRMTLENKVKAYHYVQQMYQFQEKGCYYLFNPSSVAGGVDIELTITMPDGSGGCFREDQRFARVRNAAFLTQHPTLLCVLYRRIKDVITGFPETHARISMLMQFFNSQFHEEFPSLSLAKIAPLDKNYTFQNDWGHVRNLVHDLELGNPILRAWITEDAEDDGIPADPTLRYQGKYWDFVQGPTFRAGSADRRDWGAGWYGMDDKKWQNQLNRKYLKMVTDELAKVETELEGEII